MGLWENGVVGVSPEKRVHPLEDNRSERGCNIVFKEEDAGVSKTQEGRIFFTAKGCATKGSIFSDSSQFICQFSECKVIVRIE